jgi:hypothetical protein
LVNSNWVSLQQENAGTSTSKPGFSKPANRVPPVEEKTAKKEKKIKEKKNREVSTATAAQNLKTNLDVIVEKEIILFS